MEEFRRDKSIYLLIQQDIIGRDIFCIFSHSRRDMDHYVRLFPGFEQPSYGQGLILHLD